MKTIIISTVLVLLFVNSIFSQSLPTRPQDVHPALAKAWNTGDVTKIVTLYENEGILIPQPGQSVSGKVKLKEALLGFLSTKGVFEIETVYCIQAGDVAMSRSIWSITDNGVLKIKATGTELLRKQKDGTWLMAVDNPFGADALITK